MDASRYGPFPYSAIIDRPILRWPNGARVAVWVIPNIEFFPLNELIPREVAITPSIIPWARRDYGNRVGIFRLMDVLAERGIRGTAAINSDICHEHPRIVEAAVALQWEFMGHCQTNSQLLNSMDSPTEQRVIKTSLETIEAATGRRPKGWLSAGLAETWNTVDILASENVAYVADWVNDDEPYVMDVGNPKMISIPYSNEVNDITVLLRETQSSGEFANIIKRQFDVLYREGAKRAKVLAIALHPWIIGVPHRIGSLESALDHIANHKDVWFATGSEIVEAYSAQIARD
jgi:allantoinase